MARTGSRSLSGMGYTGYPAAIFLERMNYAYGNRSHVENKASLEKWYSALCSYLPVFYEIDEVIDLDENEDMKGSHYEPDLEHSNSKQKEFWVKVFPRLNDVVKEVNATHLLYEASYEKEETCDPKEKVFLDSMRGVFERLDRITAITHIIDGIKPESYSDGIG